MGTVSCRAERLLLATGQVILGAHFINFLQFPEIHALPLLVLQMNRLRQVKWLLRGKEHFAQVCLGSSSTCSNFLASVCIF